MKSATAGPAATKPAHGAAESAIPGIPPETLSGIPVKPLYTEADLPGDVEQRLAPPGEFPYLRGLHPGMYRARLWTMRQFAGYGSAAQTNERFHYLLKHGGTGLSTAFDMPTLMGYDADHAMSLGEVGREGVAVSTLEDMEILFQGIPLGEVTTSMTINAPAIVLLAMYVAVGERHGIPAAKLGGTVQADMLKEYIAQKEWIIPPRPAVKLCVDMIEWCAANMPKWNSISISGYHIREAGATAAQELAFTLADGIGYVEECVKRGMDVDSFAPRLSFFWDVHNDFFEEIAKFRAGRKIWATVMRDRFGAKSARSLMLRTHAQTAGVSLTAQQPLNNVARVAIQALAAVLGGTQSLHTNSMDETLALPTEEAATVALRTQQIIAYETGVVNTPDPLAGSYFVEALTAKIEEEAQAYIRRIDEMGGIIVAVEKGYPQKEIADSAYQFQQQVERGERVIVGVNKFQAENEEITIPVLKIDPAIERGQIERVRAVRARRAKAPYEQSMAALRDACMSAKNLMPYVLDAVRAEATLGEICDVFREAYGVYREPAVF
ncbi:MAG TPA: methylmalonyl-CoA mutase family protein [Candidatus Binatia bacterium]|nr:methylmalonyl-CoA mutase family protein [Candidatus Binatia bacterium]